VASLENFRIVVFRAVAERGSFRKAAEELYLTQPAVSLQIKALEEGLGVQLFDRTGAKIALTAAGSVLLRYAIESRELFAEAEREIASISGEQAGTLALGASTTIAQYVLPSLLGAFRKHYPRVAITLMSGNTETIVHALEAQSIALGLLEGPAHNRDVHVVSFLVDELVLIAPSAHEWAERGTIRAEELAEAPLLLREPGSGTRHVVETALTRAGIKRSSLNVVMELDSTESIKSAVEAGLGVGFISEWALARDARIGSNFRKISVEGMRIERNFSIASLAHPRQHDIAQTFHHFLLGRARMEDETEQSRPVCSPGADKKRK
jgi:LysR family transcriptional regulator, transcriptional activator of the cysJI operon